MSAGGGQLTVLYANNSDGTAAPLAKLYHYAAGTTTLKNIFSDEAMTSTLAQPFIADSAGKFVFYANGDYKFRIDDASDSTLDTWDDYHVSTGQSLLNDYDTSIPAATAASKGVMKAKIDGGSVVREIGLSNGSAYTLFYEADSSGNQILDSVITKVMPVINVKHSNYGALGDGSNEDTAAIQSAINKAQTDGTGVVYLPKGTYVVDGSLTVTNCSIKFKGDGTGQTIILQKNSPAGTLLAYSTNDTEDMFMMEDISIQTQIGSVTSGDNAITAAWLEESGIVFQPNCYMNRVSIIPTNATKTTSGFDKYVQLTHAKKPIIKDCEFRGHSGGALEGDGITLLGYTYKPMIIDTLMIYLDLGLNVSGAATGDPEEINLFQIYMSDCRQNIDIDVSANFSIKSSTLVSNEGALLVDGVTLGKLEVIGNRIAKHSTSSSNWTGIDVEATDYVIAGNEIYDGGSPSGTDYGVSVAVGTDGVITGNVIKDIRTNGVRIAAGISDFVVSGNRINTSVIGINVLTGASDDYVIKNNNLEGCTTPVTDAGTGTNKIIKDNNPTVTWTAVASAATITGPSTTDLWEITGSSDIDTINASYPNRIVTLKWTAAAPGDLTVAGNIHITGGALFSPSQNGIAHLRSDGTDWWAVSVVAIIN
jgi:hypothetical protein